MTGTQPPQAVRLIRPARMDELPLLLAAGDQACGLAGNIPPDRTASVRLVLEEVCVNIIKHGYRDGAPGDIELRLQPRWRHGSAPPDTANDLQLTVLDRAQPFQPEDVPPPDLQLPWEDRAIGGLGWHLVRSLVTHLEHSPRPGGGNVLTLVLPLATSSDNACK